MRLFPIFWEEERDRVQSSDSLYISLLLAFAGGIMDATAYMTRGNVFTYAVTGNLIFLAISAVSMDFTKALTFIIPILSFNLGIFASEVLRGRLSRMKTSGNLHWRQYVLMVEILFIVVSSLIPMGGFNYLSNILMSFITALKTETFRKFHNNPYASTMCTGNMRSATFHLQKYLESGERKNLRKSLSYYLIILSFFTGAVTAAITTGLLGGRTVILAIIPLATVIIMMNRETSAI